jgi:hypothetical protein
VTCGANVAEFLVGDAAIELDDGLLTLGMSSNRHDIADRLRLLFAKDFGNDIRTIARALKLDEVELRMSLDDIAPYPTLNVLSVAVEYYGVDPTWLITGEYDQETHWQTLEGGRRMAEDVLSRLAVTRCRQTPPRIDTLPAEKALRLA